MSECVRERERERERARMNVRERERFSECWYFNLSLPRENIETRIVDCVKICTRNSICVQFSPP